MTQASSADQQLLVNAYQAFNDRNLDGALATMHADVDWPNGMEGGRVYGHDGVREYWTRQWSLIDPRVQPVGFQTDEAGRIIVDVHTVVRDLTGALLADENVLHVYTIEEGLIRTMEIRKAPAPS